MGVGRSDECRRADDVDRLRTRSRRHDYCGGCGRRRWKSDDAGTDLALALAQAALAEHRIAGDRPEQPGDRLLWHRRSQPVGRLYPGVGLYRSLDGGETWQLLAPADTTRLPPASAASLSIRSTPATSFSEASSTSLPAATACSYRVTAG